MAEYRLSSAAATDLANIADYTIQCFGVYQARHYRDELEACFQILVENPQLGRVAYEVATHVRCHPHQSHIIFYVPADYGILIVRVLNQNRDFSRLL